MKDAIWYGKNWTYDECLAKIEEPSLTNSGLSELEQSTLSNGPLAGILSYSDAKYSTPSAYLRPWGRFGPSYKYYANMMGTVSATLDTFFQNQQTNFTNHISGTVHGYLKLTTQEDKAGGIGVSYSVVMDRNDALVLNTFRTIFDEMGRSECVLGLKKIFHTHVHGSTSYLRFKFCLKPVVTPRFSSFWCPSYQWSYWRLSRAPFDC